MAKLERVKKLGTNPQPANVQFYRKLPKKLPPFQQNYLKRQHNVVPFGAQIVRVRVQKRVHLVNKARLLVP